MELIFADALLLHGLIDLPGQHALHGGGIDVFAMPSPCRKLSNVEPV